MKKIPYGIINFKELITEGYEYIDKTMYLEKLENIGKTLIYLRPGRFTRCLCQNKLGELNKYISTKVSHIHITI